MGVGGGGAGVPVFSLTRQAPSALFQAFRFSGKREYRTLSVAQRARVSAPNVVSFRRPVCQTEITTKSSGSSYVKQTSRVFWKARVFCLLAYPPSTSSPPNPLLCPPPLPQVTRSPEVEEEWFCVS